MPWTKITLSSDQVKEGEMKKLQSKFRDIFHEAGMPVEMALFTGIPFDSSYPFYFSPACSEACKDLILEYSGKSCSKPKKTGMEPTMVIGYNRGWDLLLE